MFIVPVDTPGVTLVRDVANMEQPYAHFGMLGGHTEILYEDVRLPSGPSRAPAGSRTASYGISVWPPGSPECADGRSMFADGSKVPYDRTRRLIEKLAVPLKATPLRVSIAGHTAAGFVPTRSDYGAFDLSADRANAVRQILEREGLPPSHIFAVSGKADTQPLFPDDPSLAANRRVTITLMREDPPLPPNLKP